MSTINRKPHILKPEKTLAIPRHYIFFDTETTQVELPNYKVEQRLKLGWACYYRKAYGRNLSTVEWFSFTDAVDFWAFVFKHTEKKRKLWVIARRIVFDFTIVEGWKHLAQVGFKLKFFYDGGTTSIISVKGQHGSIVFLDSMNWFVESLAKTGEHIGIPKLKIDFAHCTFEYLSTYCKRDVEIELENFKRFIKFLESQSISRLCYTRGSTAMAAYLFSHYKKKIYIHNNKEAIALERESYRGGRTECFYLGELKDENYYILDVNSLYPFVMRDNCYPVKYKNIAHGVTLESLQTRLKTESVVAKVLIDTDEAVYAVRRKRTIFPVGRFWVTLTTPELKYALSKGHIVKIEDAVFYEQGCIFKTYVDRFYKMRLKFKADGVAEYEEFCKKLLNSLYGKFGQKAEVWTKVGDCPHERNRVELCFVVGVSGVKQIRYLLGEIFELTGYEECFNSFPAIAAHVAAYARLHLYKLMKMAGDGNYFYCDTDSLFVNKTGLWELSGQIDAFSLGGLKIVDTMNQLSIRGLKDYSTGTKQVIKGIRKNAKRIAEGVYEQEQWPSFKGLLRTASTETYTVKKITKVLNRQYTKGIVEANGSVVPFRLDERADFVPELF